MPNDRGDTYAVDGEPGVPRDEGESWDDVAERRRPEATIDVFCPNECFEVRFHGSHDLRDAGEFLQEVAIDPEFGTCPHCGAATDQEVVEP
mgnify:CR=1 FL=1